MKPVARIVASLGLFTIAALLTAGCAGRQGSIEPNPQPLAGAPATQADARAEAVRADPVGYLRQVAANCRALEQYTLTFTRQERRGLLNLLYGPERIACWFRREPFSIRMKWLDPEVKYGESTYVAGEQGNKVRFVPRHGLFGLPPRITAVELQTPVIWGESKYPLTTFGLERLMERTLRTMDEAGNGVTVTYQGMMTLNASERIVHHLRLEYAPKLHRTPLQDLYIDVETDLPAATVLKYSSGRLDAAYVYEDLDPKVALVDEDFLLDAERALSEQRTEHAAHAEDR
jgi:hypothetical protein